MARQCHLIQRRVEIVWRPPPVPTTDLTCHSPMHVHLIINLHVRMFVLVCVSALDMFILYMNTPLTHPRPERGIYPIH